MVQNFYNRYVPVSTNMEEHGMSKNSFYANVHNCSNPERFIIKYDGQNYIDMQEYKKQRNITRECWIVNTDALYWLMEELFDTRTDMARYLADKSSKYSSVNSWMQFLTNDMFALPLDKGGGVELKLNMQIEFTRLASRCIYNMIKSGFYANSEE